MVFLATSVYPTGMGYLVALPSLLCGLAISVEDIRCRRVPRLWVAVGCLLQLVALIVAALLGNDLFLVLQAALCIYLIIRASGV